MTSHALPNSHVIASMQPYHAIDDGRWAQKRLGAQRMHDSYVFRSLLDSGATLAFGSDWPVAPMDPLMGIYAAVTRRTLDDHNPGGWVPEQKISVAEAVHAYTVGSAYAQFDEKIKGSLEPGKLADLVVLSRDIFHIDPVEIQNTPSTSPFAMAAWCMTLLPQRDNLRRRSFLLRAYSNDS